MAEPSYVHGASDKPLLGEPIFHNLRRTADRFGERDALVVAHQAYRATYHELVAQCADPRQRLLGITHSGGKPGLEQLRLGEQVIEAAGEVRQTLFRRPSLPGTDWPFTFGGVRVHRAIWGYPPPTLRIAAGPRDDRWGTG